MRFATAASLIACIALLAGCGKSTSNTGADQDQERLADEKAAEQLSAQHEQDAAIDEQKRLLALKAAPATPSPAAVAEAPVRTTPVAPAPAPEETPAQEVSYQQFYDSLSPYGTWMQLPDYGYVWQPAATVQDINWRPYTQGHWVYTDDGWTWVSAEPFGWITCHYGRWMRTHTLGWAWVPGDEWAPAWVSWRYGNDFVGWAPLPPEAAFNPASGIQQWADQQYGLGPDDYVFVPASAFGEEDMADQAEPLAENTPIYDDSNNETNIYYDAESYAIICYGPSYEFIQSKSRRRLQPILGLHRGGFPGLGKGGSPTLSGTTLYVSAPRISGGRTAVPPKLHGTVTDTRLTSPVRPTASNSYAAPPAEYPIEPRPPDEHVPLNRPEQRPQATPGALNENGAPPPPQTAPPAPAAMAGRQYPPGRQEDQPPPPPPLAPRSFIETNPAPGNARGNTPAPGAADQARQEQIVRDQQAQRAAEQKAEEERQAAEQARAADQARQAEEVRAQEAARDEAAAHEQAARASAQAASAPAGTQAPSGAQAPAGNTGRGQQQ